MVNPNRVTSIQVSVSVCVYISVFTLGNYVSSKIHIYHRVNFKLENTLLSYGCSRMLVKNLLECWPCSLVLERKLSLLNILTES